MAYKTADRVKEQTTITGTGTYNMDGAITGNQTFVAGIGDGNSCKYTATDGTNWEIGIGTVTDGTPDTLTRDTILASSNAGAAVSWAAGTKNIFVTNPANDIAGKSNLYIRNISNLQDATAQTSCTAGVDTTLKLTGTGSNNFSTFNVGTGKLQLDTTFDSNQGGVIVDQMDPQTILHCRLTVKNIDGTTSGIAKIFLVFDKTTPGTGVQILSSPREFRSGVEVPIEFIAFHGGIEAIKVQMNSDNTRTFQVNGFQVVAHEIITEV